MKYYVKGARIWRYPPHFQLYRKSRGIKTPVRYVCTESEAMQLVDNAKLTYERTIQIINDDGSVINIINTRQFNKNAK